MLKRIQFTFDFSNREHNELLETTTSELGNSFLDDTAASSCSTSTIASSNKKKRQQSNTARTLGPRGGSRTVFGPKKARTVHCGSYHLAQAPVLEVVEQVNQLSRGGSRDAFGPKKARSVPCGSYHRAQAPVLEVVEQVNQLCQNRQSQPVLEFAEVRKCSTVEELTPVEIDEILAQYR